MESKTVIYFKHGIGNLVMFSPAIQAIASMDQSGQVDICLDSEWKDYRRPAFDDYFKNWNVVQNIINYSEDKFTKEYKVWFYTGHVEHSAALDIFRNKNKLQPDEPDWSTGIHEIYYYMNIAMKYGYAGITPAQYIPMTKTDILNRDKKLIGLCNGTYSGKMKNVKMWPYFGELAKLLKYYFNCSIIKVGFSDELNNVEADYDYVNKLTLTQTASIIDQLDLFICNDTGLMHVADALQSNIIVIWGGSSCSKNGAVNKDAYNLKLNIHCQPCQTTEQFFNCENPICLNNLTVGDVINVVKKKL